MIIKVLVSKRGTVNCWRVVELRIGQRLASWAAAICALTGKQLSAAERETEQLRYMERSTAGAAAVRGQLQSTLRTYCTYIVLKENICENERSLVLISRFTFFN